MTTVEPIGATALGDALHAMGVAELLRSRAQLTDMAQRTKDEHVAYPVAVERIADALAHTGEVSSDLDEQLVEVLAREHRTEALLAGVGRVVDRLDSLVTERRRSRADVGLAALRRHLRAILEHQPSDAAQQHAQIRAAQVELVEPALVPRDSVRSDDRPDHTARLLVEVLGTVRNPSGHIDLTAHLRVRAWDPPRTVTLDYRPVSRQPDPLPWAVARPQQSWAFVLEHQAEAWVPTMAQLREQLATWRDSHTTAAAAGEKVQPQRREQATAPRSGSLVQQRGTGWS